MRELDFSFTCAGDMLIQRRLPETYEGFEKLVEFISRGDMRYFNLETTINRGEMWGNQYGGGSWLRINPSVLDDARRMGFNMLCCANNHTLDFSHWGLLATLDALDRAEFPHAGAGRNLAEAAAPAYLDMPTMRFALICCCSSLNTASIAGEQSRRFMGRPGVNPLRREEKYIVTREQMKVIREILDATHMNAAENISRKEGYLPALPDNIANMKNIMFEEGPEPKRISTFNEKDMKRIERSIFEAQMQADFIAIGIHSHELAGDKKETPDDFLVEFAHRCIDAGAHAVIGSGPHLMRPIEIYKGCPIFYSLGDFMLQNENIPFAPEDFFEMYGLSSDDTMRDLFTKRSNNFTRGLQTDHRMLETFVPHCEYKAGKLSKLVMMPVELGFGLPRSVVGLPHPMPHAPFINDIIEMSKPYGTTIKETPEGYAEVVL